MFNDNILTFFISLNDRSEKIILDVDAGVDDALAIMIALLDKNISGPEIIAITCTHGNIDLVNVAINVLKTLRVIKKDVSNQI